MSRPHVRGWWAAAFLAVTGVAVVLELVAAWGTGPDIAPWTELLSGWVPAPVTMAATAVLVVWAPVHFVRAYRRRRQREVDVAGER